MAKRRGTRAGMVRLGTRRAYRPNAALKKIQKQLSAAKSRTAVYRKKAANPAMKLGATVAIAAGGAADGAAAAYMPEIMGFNTGLIAGVALVGASTLIKDKTVAGGAACLGAGMLAAWASKTTENMLVAQAPAAPAV